MTPPLSETVSKKRGRPRRPPGAYAARPGLCSAQSAHGRADWDEQSFAVYCLAQQWRPEFAWLFGAAEDAASFEQAATGIDRGATLRQGILVALGRAYSRFPHEEAWLDLASYLCELRPTVREGVRIVRATAGTCRPRGGPANRALLRLARASDASEADGASLADVLDAARALVGILEERA